MFRLAGGEVGIPGIQRVGLKNAQALDDLLGPQQTTGGACGNQIVVRHRRLIHIKVLALIARRANISRNPGPLLVWGRLSSRPAPASAAVAPQIAPTVAPTERNSLALLRIVPTLGVAPGICARQQQHVGFSHNNIVNLAIGYHRQPAHRMNRLFRITDRFQRDLQCVLFEKNDQNSAPK